MRIHIVQKGDTLEKIANKYNVSVEEIKNVNIGIGTGELERGSKVKIPSPEVVINRYEKKKTPFKMPGFKKEAPKEMPKKEMPVKEMPKKEMPIKEAPKKEVPKKEAPKKEQPLKEFLKKEVPKAVPKVIPKVVPKFMPKKEVPKEVKKEVPAKEIPKNIPIKEEIPKNVPLKETVPPKKDVVVQKEAAKKDIPLPMPPIAHPIPVMPGKAEMPAAPIPVMPGKAEMPAAPVPGKAEIPAAPIHPSKDMQPMYIPKPLTPMHEKDFIGLAESSSIPPNLHWSHPNPAPYPQNINYVPPMYMAPNQEYGKDGMDLHLAKHPFLIEESSTMMNQMYTGMPTMFGQPYGHLDPPQEYTMPGHDYQAMQTPGMDQGMTHVQSGQPAYSGTAPYMPPAPYGGGASPYGTMGTGQQQAGSPMGSPYMPQGPQQMSHSQIPGGPSYGHMPAPTHGSMYSPSGPQYDMYGSYHPQMMPGQMPSGETRIPMDYYGGYQMPFMSQYSQVPQMYEPMPTSPDVTMQPRGFAGMHANMSENMPNPYSQAQAKNEPGKMHGENDEQ